MLYYSEMPNKSSGNLSAGMGGNFHRNTHELLKLGIELDKKTRWNILHTFRRKGKVKRGVTWAQFLKTHIKSLYAMDFFTVDTVLNQRFYVFFIIRHQTREIIQFGMTLNPVKEFVRQQMIEFAYDLKDMVYLIHDRTGEFKLKFDDYGKIKSRSTLFGLNYDLS